MKTAFLKFYCTFKITVLPVLLILLGPAEYSCLDAQNCMSPFPLSVQEVDTSSALVNWLQPGQADSFEISWRLIPEPFPPEPQITGIDNNSYRFLNLLDGGLYEYRVRARCDNQFSPWSRTQGFITNLTTPSRCQVFLPIGDNNCNSGGNVFKIQVTDRPGSLGSDVFLSEVRMIVSHSWPADLRVFLRNPAGNEITLTADNGIGGNNYGNPHSEDCSEATIFSDDACEMVGSASPPFIGRFRPETPLSVLHDFSNANGIWELFICDKAPGDIGELLHFEIVFEEFYCRPPTISQISDATDTTVQVFLSPGEGCDSSLLVAGPPGFDPLAEGIHSFYFSCETDQLTLSGLLPGQEYELYALAFCGSDSSGFSCPSSFSTLCSSPNLRSDFNSEIACELVCNSNCELTGWWRNIDEFGAYWLVNEGPTPTDNTGPNSAFSGSGNYVFYQSAGLQCQDPSKAILESACIDINSSGGNCDMSFRYHQWGAQIGKLELLLSVDGGFFWDTLWSRNGSQADNWMEGTVELSAYDGMTGRFRFIAYGGNGPLGDIALDEIILFGSSLADTSSLIYFIDNDGDGFGQDGTGTFFCSVDPPDGWAATDGDCDDENPDINPDAEVVPCNLVDENCTGLADDQPEDNPMIAQLAQKINESCSGASDGMIDIEISGGFPPYQISWNNGVSGNSAENLSSGVYFAIVEDSSGCLYRTDFYTIQVESSMSFTFANVVRPGCSSFSNGSMEVLTGGGTPPFSYSWNNGDTMSAIENLPEGLYQVTVSDAAGCEFESPVFNLAANNPFSIQVVEQIAPSCHGSNNGSMRIQTQGGQAPFLFEWDNGHTSAQLENLDAGYYSVSVADSTNCIISLDSVFLPQPDPLIVDFFSVQPPVCPGESTGRILTHVQGGTFPYTFFWQSANRTFTTRDLLNVPGGEYNFRATDLNGCSFEASVLMPEPPAFELDVKEIRNVSCGNREDGSLATEISGGIPPYQIFWNSGETDTNQLAHLSTGFYRFTLTDQAGCKYTSPAVEITNLNIPLPVSLEVLDSISCNGANDGVIKASVDSEYFPIRYNWSHLSLFESYSNSDTVSGLSPNNYSIVITDATSCIGVSDNYFLVEPAELILTESDRKMPSCNGDSNGSLRIHHFGGSPPFNYIWNTGDSLQIAEHLSSGTYSVTVSDKNGCFKTRSNILLADPPVFHASFFAGPDDGTESGFIELELNGGILPYEIRVNPDAGSIENTTISGLAHGDYLVEVEDNNGCIIDSLITIELANFIPEVEVGELRVYPNPASGAIIIEWEGDAVWNDLGILRIVNSMGMELIKAEGLSFGSEKKAKIDTTGLPPGPYILTLETGGGYHRAIFIKK